MKNKGLVLLPFLIIVIGICINFSGFLMGTPPNIIHIITTLLYIAFGFIFTWKSRGNKVLLKCSIFISGITFLTAIIAILVITFDVSMFVSYFLVTIFLTPLYGVRVVGTWILTYAVIVCISITWFAFGIILAKRTK